MIGVAVAATGWNYEHRAAQTQKVMEQANKDPLPSDGTSLDSLIRDHNVQPVIYRAPQLTPTPAPVLQKPELQAAPNSQPGTDAAEQARWRAWLAYYSNQAQVEQARFSAEKTALAADTAIGNGQAGTDPAVSGGASGAAVGIASAPALIPPSGYGAVFPSGVASVPAGLGYSPAVPDVSGAREKQAFMTQAGDTSGASDTLMARVRDPISPYLITAGDFINCVSMGGENSDAPGMFVGRVTNNVYDSATGHYLLIPQGSKVVGVYDNVVSQGQTRIPTAITRIIFPDSEFDRPGFDVGRGSKWVCRAA